MVARIPIDRDRIADFCRRHHIRKLSLFGSVLRDDFGADSDVDVLVEFEPGQTPGLAFFDMEKEFASLVGRDVDLVTETELSRWIREEVLANMETVYAAP